MSLTIQYASKGRWMNLLGHGCETVGEMQAYADMADGMRVADESTEGEEAPMPPQDESMASLTRAYETATPEGKARLLDAVDEVVKALRT